MRELASEVVELGSVAEVELADVGAEGVFGVGVSQDAQHAEHNFFEG